MSESQNNLAVHFQSLPELVEALKERVHTLEAEKAGLRRALFLAGQGLLVEQHYKAADVAVLVCRSTKHVVQEAKRGAFGRVFFDAGGWLIPASGVTAWLELRRVGRTASQELKRAA